MHNSYVNNINHQAIYSEHTKCSNWFLTILYIKLLIKVRVWEDQYQLIEREHKF